MSSEKWMRIFSKMNKYCIKSFLGDQLKDYYSTFKDTSFDKKHEQHLCADENVTNVFNFDEYVSQKFDSPLPASPDAIYLATKKFYFVEFKNSNPKDIDRDNLKNKFEKGTKILQDLLKEFTPKDVEFIFCVVHKASTTKSISKYFNPSHIESNVPKFGLESKNKELGNFYDRIITEDVDFYKKQLTDLRCR